MMGQTAIAHSVQPNLHMAQLAHAKESNMPSVQKKGKTLNIIGT